MRGNTHHTHSWVSALLCVGVRSTNKHSKVIFVLIRKVIIIYNIPLSSSNFNEQVVSQLVNQAVWLRETPILHQRCTLVAGYAMAKIAVTEGTEAEGLTGQLPNARATIRSASVSSLAIAH